MRDKLRKMYMRTVSFLMLFCMFTGLFAGAGEVQRAEAATNTYACPHAGYDLIEEHITGYYMIVNPIKCYSKSWYGGTSNASSYTSGASLHIPYYAGASFLQEGSPVVGDMVLYSDIKVSCDISFDYSSSFICNMYIPIVRYKCGVCGQYYAKNGFDRDIDSVYVAELTCTAAGSNPEFEITAVKTAKEYMESSWSSMAYILYYETEDDDYSSYTWQNGWVTPDAVSSLSHTYSVEHTCGNACREQQHRHETIWDETVYEYTCDCVETYKSYSFSAPVNSSSSICGHTYDYTEAEYSCALCGEYLYRVTHTGCDYASCDNYYKKQEDYCEEIHPGEHSYMHAGERYICTAEYAINKEGSSSGGGLWYDATCAVCGQEIGFYQSISAYSESFYGSVLREIQTMGTADVGHYYYVKKPLGGCYSYGELHKASSTTSKSYTIGPYTCDCGQSYANLQDIYSCKDCSAELYELFDEGCGNCGRTFDIFCKLYSGELIGMLRYNNTPGSSVETSNPSALHRSKSLTCSTVTYGELVCDKVVTELIPLVPEQSTQAGETVDKRAYAKFLDGHMELVECSLAYDIGRYNEWQEATLSYGSYSSVSSKEPQTATIKLYVECLEFPLSVTVQDASMGTAEGSGEFLAGTEVEVSAAAEKGYVFEGWYDKNGTKVSNEAKYSFTMPANSLELTAKFVAEIFSLTVSLEYPSAGAASVTVNGQAVTSMPYKGKFLAKAVPAEDYIFNGWYDGTTLLGEETEQELEMPPNDFVLLASFMGKNVTVSFDSVGGTACEPIEVAYQGNYGKLPLPVKDGYVFLGWKLDSQYITEVSTVKEKTAHTLVAEWTEEGPDGITVDYGKKYGDNSWSTDKSQIGKLGLTEDNFGMHLPLPLKRGYSFLNWYLAENSQGNGADLGNPENEIEAGTIVGINENHDLHAGWQEKKFTLTFASNGGTECQPMIVAYDRSWEYYGSLPVPEKNGYIFDGWYTSNLDGNGAGVRINSTDGGIDTRRVDILSDMTVYAKWLKEEGFRKPLEVTVVFDPKTREQAGLTPEESIALGYGSTIGTVSAAEEQRIVTWPGTYGNFEMLWCECGESIHEAYPKHGERHYLIDYSSVHEELPLASRLGYDFSGWEYDGLLVEAETATMAAYAHTLYASYKAKTYSITLDAQGADCQEQSNAVATFDKELPEIRIPQKTGYVFQGYYTGTGGSGIQYYDAGGKGIGIWDSEELNMDGSQKVVVLYAFWKPMVEVSYDANGGTGTMESIWLLPGITSVEIMSNSFIRTGCVFSGWNTKADGTGVSYYEGQKVDGIVADLKLYAQWEIKTKRIVFRGNGGMGTMEDMVMAETVTSTKLPENVFTRAGCEFSHWCTLKECPGAGMSGHEDYLDRATVSSFNGILVLYAQWKELETRYTLVYMKYPYGSMDNEIWKQEVLSEKQEHIVAGVPYVVKGCAVAYDLNISESMSTKPEKLLLEEKNMVAAPADFERWNLYRNKNGKLVYSGTGYIENTSVSGLAETDGEVLYLYPKWQDGNNSVVLPEAAAEGYSFLGWSENPNESGTVYTSDVGGENGGMFTPVKDTTLYAVWKPLSKVVQLKQECNGKTPEDPGQTEVEFVFDDDAPEVMMPKSSRYSIEGYFTKPDGGGFQVYDGDGKGLVVTNNINRCFDGISVLYAKWTANTYMLVLNPNGGSLAEECQGPFKVVYGKSAYNDLSTCIPERTGYTFLGWYTEKSGGVRVYDDAGNCTNEGTYWKDGLWCGMEDVTLYAQWRANQYKLEIDLNKTSGTGGVSVPFAEITLTFDSANHRYNAANHTDYLAGNLPEWTGYQFIGFYDAPTDGTMVYNASGMPVNEGTYFKGGVYIYPDDMVVYAYYKAKKYTVSLDGQGATTQEQDSVVMIFDEIATEITVPQKKGYAFKGYFTEKEGNGIMVYDNSGQGCILWNGEIAEQIQVLYACWEKKELERAEIDLFSIDDTYIVRANLLNEEGLPTLEWREFGDTMLELSVKTVGFFEYAIVNAPWENSVRTFYWDDGTYTEDTESWSKQENIIFWRSQLLYPEEEDKVRNNPGYNDQTYTIKISFYIADQLVKEYKVGLYMVPWSVWREEIHPSREGGSWDFNGDGIPDRWPFENGT